MKVLVFAPHPDDETLGCGGTLLRHKNEGDDIYLAIVTKISTKDGWAEEKVINRTKQIKKISKGYNFSDIFNFKLPAAKLDTIPIATIVNEISKVYEIVKPELIFIPNINDVHTDHEIISRALHSTLKWFRYPFIKKALMYETPSETEFNFIGNNSFNPKSFIDISDYIDEKIKIMSVYEDEMGHFPFPRSEKVIRSLAALRGSQSGYSSAEAFELIYERK